MTHDRVPRILYEHPIVEYIPLAVETLGTGALPPAASGLAPGGVPIYHPDLWALADRDSWNQAAALHPYAFPPGAALASAVSELADPMLGRRRLVFLAIGFMAASGIYRGRKVSLATENVGPVYHLFSLPLKYFYKPSIDFVAYSAYGAPLAQVPTVDVGPRPAPTRRS